MSVRSENRIAAERWDIVEEEMPRAQCHVRGCERQALYEWAGEWGTRWLCRPHRLLYRRHSDILWRIRNLT